MSWTTKSKYYYFFSIKNLLCSAHQHNRCVSTIAVINSHITFFIIKSHNQSQSKVIKVNCTLFLINCCTVNYLLRLFIINRMHVVNYYHLNCGTIHFHSYQYQIKYYISITVLITFTPSHGLKVM